MTTVILTIHTLIVLTLIGVVLLQRSEGGALGIGGGGGGGFMTGRGAANALTRTTSILAALFFATSISLAVFADRGESDAELIRELTGENIAEPEEAGSLDALRNTLGRDEDETPPPDASAASDGARAPQTDAADAAIEALSADIDAASEDAAAQDAGEAEDPTEPPQ